MDNTVHIGTRNSRLAIRQTELIAMGLEEAVPGIKIMVESRQTAGDKLLDRPLQDFGGKGIFVSEFEQEILDGKLDLAVHSAKDLPVNLAGGLAIVGVPLREDPRDVLVTMAGRPMGGMKRAVLGTSSPRRKLQVEITGRKLWPHVIIECRDVRGNIYTRLNKLEKGMYDALILAAAGIKRLGLEKSNRYQFQYLDCEEFIPAGGQGILAVEGREDTETASFCQKISHGPSWRCLLLERRVLELLDSGCHEPVGVYAREKEGLMMISGIRERNGSIYRIQMEDLTGQMEYMAAMAAEGLGGR